ncbi:unnamed protein product [Soboliphyme baturini]|uniref:DUF4201 domain-containing protein n=1 Tax=Soboliphyme baturini TaxID=241478 RepID=A0A183IRA2_9BILA|nr:unnamed protein product [Soboliphyme baturini]
MDQQLELPYETVQSQETTESKDSARRTVFVEALCSSSCKGSGDEAFLNELSSMLTTLGSDEERLNNLVEVAKKHGIEQEQLVHVIATGIKAQENIKNSIDEQKREIEALENVISEFYVAANELYQALPQKAKDYTEDNMPLEISQKTAGASSGEKASIMTNKLIMAVAHLLYRSEMKSMKSSEKLSLDQEPEAAVLEAVLKTRKETLELYDEEIKRTEQKVCKLCTSLKQAFRKVAGVESVNGAETSPKHDPFDMTSIDSGSPKAVITNDSRTKMSEECVLFYGAIQYVRSLLKVIEEQRKNAENCLRSTKRKLDELQMDARLLKLGLRRADAQAKEFVASRPLNINLETANWEGELVGALRSVLKNFRAIQQTVENESFQQSLCKIHLENKANNCEEQIMIIQQHIQEEYDQMKRLKGYLECQLVNMRAELKRTREETEQIKEMNARYNGSMEQQLIKVRQVVDAGVNLGKEIKRKMPSRSCKFDQQEKRLREKTNDLLKEQKMLRETLKMILEQLEKTETQMHQQSKVTSLKIRDTFQRFKAAEQRRLQVQTKRRAVEQCKHDDEIQRTWEMILLEHEHRRKTEKFLNVEKSLEELKKETEALRSRLVGKSLQCDRVKEDIRGREKDLKRAKETQQQLQQKKKEMQEVLRNIQGETER